MLIFTDAFYSKLILFLDNIGKSKILPKVSFMIFADKYKLCSLSRKPKPVAVRDTGGWYLAFRITAIISIISNCGLIALDLRNTAGADWSDWDWFKMFVIIEHVFVVIFCLMATLK